MTAEDSAAIGSLVAQASILKDQLTAALVQVEAFELNAKALGRRVALGVKAEPPAPAQPDKPRHYGPRRTG